MFEPTATRPARRCAAIVGGGIVAAAGGPSALIQAHITLGLLGPRFGQFISGQYGEVTRAELDAAAKAGGPAITVFTRQTQSIASRGFSAAAGEGAEAPTSAMRAGGKLYSAQIPKGLLAALERANVVTVSITEDASGGARAIEYRFAPGAAEFVAKLFRKVPSR